MPTKIDTNGIDKIDHKLKTFFWLADVHFPKSADFRPLDKENAKYEQQVATSDDNS